MFSWLVQRVTSLYALVIGKLVSMAASTIVDSQEMYFSTNNTRFLNPVRFGSDKQLNLQKQTHAEELLAQIYAIPFDSQATVADQLVRDNQEVAPYMIYSATKTGHVTVAKAISDSGKVLLSEPLNFENSVTKYREGKNAELFSAKAGDKAAVLEKWLEEFSRSEDENQLVFDAAVAGDAEVVKLLLEKGVNPYPPHDPSLASLHAACFHGHLKCAQTFVDSGVDVNIRDDFGGTPIMRAAVGGRTGVVQWLLDNGAIGNARETRKGNFNALEYTAGRSTELARLLLDSCGFSPTALMAAASFGNQESFNLLIEAGAFPAVPSNGVDSPFWKDTLSEEHREAIIGSIEQAGNSKSAPLMKQLITYIPIRDLGNHEDIKAALDGSIQRAISCDNDETTQLLLSIMPGASQSSQDNVRNSDIDQYLCLAARSNAQKTARLLLTTHNANVNYLGAPHNTTPLYFAASHGHLEMLRLLVAEHSADIHMGSGKFANGPTALAVAITNKHEVIVRTLLSNGGPVDFVDPAIKEGVTKRVFTSAATSTRYPVRLLAKMDQEWNSEGCIETFICLEYPDGWPGQVVARREDEDLKDARELRTDEEDGFVVV